MNIKNASIVAGVLLLLGIPTGWPYAYYIILRWAICGFAIFSAVGFSKLQMIGWSLVFWGVAFLFNPIVPIYLDKSTWIVIDLIAAIMFFVSINSIKEK